MTSQIIYKGQLRTEAKHQGSKTVIETDAPTDNQGKGEKFSPTDLLATSLGACMMTLMGIKAREQGVDLSGTQIEITKIMKPNPRRVGGIKVNIQFPEKLVVTEAQRKALEHTAIHCPVAKSIHPDIEQEIHFNWPAA